MSSSNEIQLLREQSRSLRLIDKTLCCAIEAVENGSGNSVFLQGMFIEGTDEMGLFTVDADSAGTYTAITNDGSSGTITLDINSGGYGAFPSPLVLGVGDTINVKRTITTSAGWYRISGTY